MATKIYLAKPGNLSPGQMKDMGEIKWNVGILIALIITWIDNRTSHGYLVS